jgi:hypothetical protein
VKKRLRRRRLKNQSAALLPLLDVEIYVVNNLAINHHIL